VILIADDNYKPARIAGYEVECCGGEAYYATTAAETLEMAGSLAPDAILLDDILACGSLNRSVCSALRTAGYGGPVLFHGGILRPTGRYRSMGDNCGWRLTRGQIDDAAKRQLPRDVRAWLSEIQWGRA